MLVTKIEFMGKNLYIAKGEISEDDLNKLREGYVVGIRQNGEITGATDIDSKPYLVMQGKDRKEFRIIPDNYAEHILMLSKKSNKNKKNRSIKNRIN